MNNITLKKIFDRPLFSSADVEMVPLMRSMLGLEPRRESTSEEPTLGFWPRVDVKETKDAYECTLDVPGVKESDIAISVTGHNLLLTGKREEKREVSDTYYAWERSFGSFKRSIALPETVDVEHVTATLEDGVLCVVLPKRAEHAAKKVTVKAIGKSTKS